MDITLKPNGPFYWKQFDTAPAIIGTLCYGNGRIFGDLTGSTVKFSMWEPGATTLLVNHDAEILDGPACRVRYVPSSMDTGIAGRFEAQFRVIWSDGKTQSCPNPGALKIIITAVPVGV